MHSFKINTIFSSKGMVYLALMLLMMWLDAITVHSITGQSDYAGALQIYGFQIAFTGVLASNFL